MVDLLSYGIAGHHGGLPDRLAASGGLADRIKSKTLPALDPVWQSEVAHDASGLFPATFRQQTRDRQAFQLAFLGRMIFSCLVDADFLDTEAFYARTAGQEVDRNWPALGAHLDDLIAAFDAAMAEKRAGADDKPLNRLRDDILSHVREKAALPPGLFTLEVPTGGGKTLATLGFALEHARRWNMERIVYAIPFTAIIEQNAAVFRAVLGEDFVLEHHSAIEDARDEPLEGRDKLRLAMENWAAPVVVTTNVQLFESLFANRPSRCRKLHNVAKAVIILDEAQTIPLALLRPCVAALDELARNYGCSIVLCTATQPALAAPRFAGGFEIGPERELAPDPAALHLALKRVTLKLAGTMSDDDLVAELAATPQGLVIVNSRQHALALYRAAKATLDGVIHLSTRQTVCDRRRILDDIRQRLRDGLPCRVIATSLVEAGVDLDFPRVWRALTGLDQIAQAAGRCNREGLRPVADSIVTVFVPSEAKPPPEIADFAAAMQRVLDKGPDDLLAPAAIKAYFEEVYWQRGDGLDKHDIAGKFLFGAGESNFAYRSVADAFRMIESGMVPVIVATDQEAKAIVDGLKPGASAAQAARKLQNYVVQVPPRARNAMLSNRDVQYVVGFGDQFAVLKNDALYTRELGLVWEDSGSQRSDFWSV